MSGRRLAILVVLIACALISGVTTAAVIARRGGPGALASPLTIAVVGDSFTAGRDNQVVWPTLLAQRTGWAVANFALPDAGFVADGQGGYAFAYQAQRSEQVRPKVVVIMSGIADAAAAFSGAVNPVAVDAINGLKLAGVRVLVVGPTWYETSVPDAIRSVSDEIRQAADQAGVPFLDALDPPWLTVEQMQADLRGVTDAGQSVIADKIAAWLRTEVAA